MVDKYCRQGPTYRPKNAVGNSGRVRRDVTITITEAGREALKP